ncbi:hypothetical protein IFR05_012691 [Cadophora sp. M221]|nr:hypothetical protein IFR05_012691 [Cadophora sp. M221]
MSKTGHGDSGELTSPRCAERELPNIGPTSGTFPRALRLKICREGESTKLLASLRLANKCFAIIARAFFLPSSFPISDPIHLEVNLMFHPSSSLPLDSTPSISLRFGKSLEIAYSILNVREVAAAISAYFPECGSPSTIMLPEALNCSYKRYKDVANVFITWLHREAIACGYKAPSSRCARVEDEDQSGHALPSSATNEHNTTAKLTSTKELLRKAQFVAEIVSPQIEADIGAGGRWMHS